MKDELAEAAKERIDGRPVVLSMSGGKDSTACALLLTEWGIEFEAVFMDTGWEHASVYEYIDTVLEPRFGPIRRLKSSKYPGGMVDLIRSKGVFPGRLMRFCTQQLKIVPFKTYIDSLDDEVVNVVGIRHEESAARANMPEWEYQRDLGCEVFRPLIKWTFEDVADVHRRHGLMPSGLYFKGADRVGCWPCFLSRKSEVSHVSRTSPERIALIAELETEVTAFAHGKFAANELFRTKTLENAADRLAWGAISREVRWPDWKARDVTDEQAARHKAASEMLTQAQLDAEVARMLKRTFFHGQSGRASMGIAEVVDWANGYGQLSFSLPERDIGCFRWGFCDTRGSDE